MTENIQAESNQKQRYFPPNPYRSILFCSKCGAPMRYEQHNLRAANPYVAYVCSTGIKTGKCSRNRIRFTYVESKIRQSLQHEIQLADHICEHIKNGNISASYNEVKERYQDEIQRILARIRHTNQKFQNLHTDYLEGTIDSECYQQQKRLLIAQTRTDGQLILEITEQIHSHRSLVTKANPWLNLYHGKSLPENLPQKLSKIYFESIYLSPDAEITVQLRYQDWKQKLIDIMRE